MSDSAIVALIAGAFTTVGIAISSYFTFAGRKLEIMQKNAADEINHILEQLEEIKKDRDYYKELLDDRIAIEERRSGKDRRTGALDTREHKVERRSGKDRRSSNRRSDES